ncbi:hypothetical protein FQA39_LY13663 [Lamprigera yunnana]|nr:hypothetical protein FQA39_LY13663 [Lamprigera yunnana]
MIDFHSTGEDKIVYNCQHAAAFSNNYKNYQANLDVASKASIWRLTGLICTYGPSINSEAMLEDMMDLGMTMIRLKMCHLTQEECEEAIKLIRKANDNYSKKIGCVYPLPIAIDIKGSEIRTGSLRDTNQREITMSQGNLVSIIPDPAYKDHVTEDMVYVDYEDIINVVESGDSIYLNNGSIRLCAIEIIDNIIKCIVNSSGSLISRANVYMPEVPIDFPEITERDLEDIKFAIDFGVDVLFIPGMRSKYPIMKLKEIIGTEGKSIQIIPKIDSYQALNKINEIIEVSDGIVINRAALSIDMPIEKVFLAQKSITAKCNLAGKPVICSSQILNSMICKCSRPTKSEACDIANAVIDGIDCFLLSQETSIGYDPLEALITLSNICKESEGAIYQRQLLEDLSGSSIPPLEPIYALAMSAVQASVKCKAAAIVMTTTSGRSAKIVARYRPRCPIIAVTRLEFVARQLHIYRGIQPLVYVTPINPCWYKDIENRMQYGITWGKVTGVIRAGDAIVLLSSSQPGAGFPNTFRIIYASEYDTISK